MNRFAFTKCLAICLAALTIATGLVGLTPRADAAVDLSQLIVTLDPGHGGTQPGNVSAEQYGGREESFYTYDICMRIKARLEARGVTVYVTRGENQTMSSNSERATIAANHGSHVFMSIHTNSYSDPAANGIEILAPNDNYRPDIGAASRAAATTILNSLTSRTGLRNRGLLLKEGDGTYQYPDGSKSDYYGIIYYGKMNHIPLVMLIEAGFASNERDYTTLQATEEARQNTAEIIADSLLSHIESTGIPSVEGGAADPDVPDAADGSHATFDFTNKTDADLLNMLRTETHSGTVGNQMTVTAVDGAVRFTATGDDPYVVLLNKDGNGTDTLGITGKLANCIMVKYKTSANSQETMEMAFYTNLSGGVQWGQPGSFVVAPIINDGEWNYVLVNTGAAFGLEDAAMQAFRIDVLDKAVNGESIDIATVKMFSSTDCALDCLVALYEGGDQAAEAYLAANYPDLIPEEETTTVVEETSTVAEETTTVVEETTTVAEETTEEVTEEIIETEAVTTEVEVESVEETAEAVDTTEAVVDTTAAETTGTMGCKATLSAAATLVAVVTALGALCIKKRNDD